jgi:hypothetical protein
MSTQSPRPQRGLTVLLWAFAAFAGVQLASSALLDYLWPQVRFPKLYEQVSRIDSFTPPASVVFLGSSRTGCLIHEVEATRAVRELTGDPAVQCYNAAVPAGDLIVSERVLRVLIARGARPRYAVVEVCPEGVNQRNAWLSMYVGWVLCWDDVPAYFKDLALTGNLVRFAGTRIIPLHVYRDQIRQQLAARAYAWWESGPPATNAVAPTAELHATGAAMDVAAAKWQQLVAESAHDAPIDRNRTTTVGLANVVRSVSRYRPGGNSAAALDRLLTLCRAHSIEPVLLTVPLSTAHRQCYTSEIEASFQAFLAAITHKHGCRYVDCRASLPDHCFIDHHHAAPDGGQLFSRKFALEVLAPIWQQPRESAHAGFSPPRQPRKDE